MIADLLAYGEAGHRLWRRRMSDVPWSGVQEASWVPFLGREALIRRVREALAGGARLVTLVGPRGMGKTHAALRAAADVCEAEDLGAAYIAHPARSHEVPTSFAVAMGLTLHRKRGPAAQVVSQLKRRRALLVVDDVPPGGPTELLGAILTHSPHSRLVLTAPGALGFPGEVVVPVPGLDGPDGDAAWADSPSGALLCAWIRRLGHIDPGLLHAPGCARLLRALGGMPLAIRLAASCLSRFGPDALIEATGRGMAPGAAPSARLTGLIKTTMELLLPRERMALRELGVFAGTFSASAAAEVASAGEDVLRRLCLLGLVTPIPGGRVMLPGAVRAIAEGELSRQSHGEAVARGRHCRYYSLFLWERERHLATAAEEVALGEIDGELAELRRAWWVAVDGGLHGEIRAALEPLRRYFEHRALPDEAAAMLDGWLARWSTLDADGPPYRRALAGLTGRVQWRRALFAWRLGQSADASARLSAAVPLLDATGQDQEAAQARAMAGLVDLSADRLAQARAHLELSLGRLASGSDPLATSLALSHLGRLDHAQGRLSSAQARFAQACALLDGRGDERSLPGVLLGWGGLLTDTACYDDAQARLERAMSLARARGDGWMVARCHMALGHLAAHRGRFHDAHTHLDEAATLHREGGERWNLAEVCALKGLLAALAGSPEEARRLSSRARILATDSGERQVAAWASCFLGRALVGLGDVGAARPALAEALGAASDLGLTLLAITAVAEQGGLELEAGDLPAARRHLETALDQSRQVGLPWVEALALTTLGRAALQEGVAREAEHHLRDALVLSWRIGAVGRAVDALVGLGVAWLRQGRGVRAVDLLEVCAASRAAEIRTRGWACGELLAQGVAPEAVTRADPRRLPHLVEVALSGA